MNKADLTTLLGQQGNESMKGKQSKKCKKKTKNSEKLT